MPSPSTGPKTFLTGPNFLSLLKNLIEFSASSRTFVPTQKPNLLNGNHLLVWHKMFGPGPTKFGTDKNILGPVKGRGISAQHFLGRL